MTPDPDVARQLDAFYASQNLQGVAHQTVISHLLIEPPRPAVEGAQRSQGVTTLPMTDTAFNVRHGSLEDVLGSPQTHDDVTFVPARVALTGTWFQPTCQLMDCIGDAPPAIVRPGEDAPWVLGRLIALFNTELVREEDRLEKTCFHAAFIAVLPGDERIAIPFECQDYYGKSALTFSTEDPPTETAQQAIGNAFWGLLLSAPEELSDYEDKMFHSGAGFWLRYGVANGEPFMIEDLDAE